MKRSTITVIIVVIVLLLIGIAIYTYIQSKKQVVSLPPPTNGGTTTSGNIVDTIIDLWNTIFKKKPALPPYVQVAPIGADGCDANGFNVIGVRCFGAF